MFFSKNVNNIFIILCIPRVGSAVDIKFILFTFSLINCVGNVYYNPQGNFSRYFLHIFQLFSCCFPLYSYKLFE